ncbi:hypothetical protein HK405_008563, partial [Cladochytrium tenue]
NLPAADLVVVELAALLHDVDDWKYQPVLQKPGTDAGAVAAGSKATAFLYADPAVDRHTADRVLAIIAAMGFKEELHSSGHEDDQPPPADAASDVRRSLPFCCVQDADRLDSIGAVGIARCFTFGGARARPLYDPDVAPRATMTREQYTDSAYKATTINHFHEKLLKLRDMMKTTAGRRLADQRHGFMLAFLDQFEKEVRGEL